jgi:hypothetical protein
MGSTDDRHTGEGALGRDNYSGIDVNRAARVAAAAAGGQVIVTDATRMLVERQAPAGVTLRDLGVHRLRDLNLPCACTTWWSPDCRPTSRRPGRWTPGRVTCRRSCPRSWAGRTRPPRPSGPGCSPSPAPAARASPAWPSTVVPSVLARALGVPEAPGRPVLEALCDHLRDRQLLLSWTTSSRWPRPAR